MPQIMKLTYVLYEILENKKTPITISCFDTNLKRLPQIESYHSTSKCKFCKEEEN